MEAHKVTWRNIDRKSAPQPVAVQPGWTSERCSRNRNLVLPSSDDDQNSWSVRCRARRQGLGLAVAVMIVAVGTTSLLAQQRVDGASAPSASRQFRSLSTRGGSRIPSGSADEQSPRPIIVVTYTGSATTDASTRRATPHQLQLSSSHAAGEGESLSRSSSSDSGSTLDVASPTPTFEERSTFGTGERKLTEAAGNGGQPIDALLVGRLAADRSATAAFLRDRASTLSHVYCRGRVSDQQAAGLLGNFLRMQAGHQEDVAAAQAMRAFYTVVALGEQLTELDAAQVDLHQHRKRLGSLAEAGVAIGLAMEELDRLELALKDSILQLQQKRRAAAVALAELTGLQVDLQKDALEVLEVMETPLNCQTLVQIALSRRRDLRGWRYLQGCVTAANSRLLAASLGTNAGVGGVVFPPKARLVSLLGCQSDQGLASTLRRELADLVAAQEQLIRTDVQRQCNDLEIAYQRVAVAEELVHSWRGSVQRLEELGRRGLGEPNEPARVTNELRAAQAALIQRRLEARMLEIDLAESVGGLADRCRLGQPWFVSGNQGPEDESQ